jgi:hypothetical protein
MKCVFYSQLYKILAVAKIRTNFNYVKDSKVTFSQDRATVNIDMLEANERSLASYFECLLPICNLANRDSEQVQKNIDSWQKR